MDELADAVRRWIERWLAEGRPEHEFADRDLDALLRRARQGANADGPNPWRFTQALTVHATLTSSRFREEASDVLRTQAAFLQATGDETD